MNQWKTMYLCGKKEKMNKIPIILSWSGGKDSSFALYYLLKSKKYDVKYLLTNIFKPNKRVSMHGVPEHLIVAQAKAIGIPLKIMYLDEKTNEAYETKMKALLLEAKAEGINTVAFGDIFLEDLREYREQRLKEIEMNAIFPLWNKATKKLAVDFIKQGFKTHICSIDNSKIPSHLIAKDFSLDFLKQLPKNIDPCGENGEFHTFCYEGPIFNYPIKFDVNIPLIKTYEMGDKIYEYTFSDIF